MIQSKADKSKLTIHDDGTIEFKIDENIILEDMPEENEEQIDKIKHNINMDSIKNTISKIKD